MTFRILSMVSYDVDDFTAGQIKPFSTVTNWRNAAPDHPAVGADFDL